MKTFNTWRLSFKKAVANASNRNPDEAFKWIAAVENAATMEELRDSGAYPELDTLLALEWERVVHGEFKSRVRSIELALDKEGKRIKGRQITWMVYKLFVITDSDHALNRWYDLMHVKLHGDNLTQFLVDWDQTAARLVNYLLKLSLRSSLASNFSRANVLQMQWLFTSKTSTYLINLKVYLGFAAWSINI